MKYKIGQRVRLLPSAINDGVYSEDCGKEGTIVQSDLPEYLQIEMKSPICRRRYWYASPENIEQVIVKGQQLLFSFMEDD